MRRKTKVNGLNNTIECMKRKIEKKKKRNEDIKTSQVNVLCNSYLNTGTNKWIYKEIQ